MMEHNLCQKVKMELMQIKMIGSFMIVLLMIDAAAAFPTISNVRFRYDLLRAHQQTGNGDDRVAEPATEIIPNNENYSSTAAIGQGNRRLFLASTLFAAGSTLNPNIAASLPWEKDPINKRSGVKVGDAELYGYNVAFIAYLSRFLLNFDADCQKFWFSQPLPKFSNSEELDELRKKQFSKFAASVEVGLQSYKGPEGANNLLKSLTQRYCPYLEKRMGELSPKQKRQRREIKEAKRQLALAFALLGEGMQPTKEITKLLAAVDNGSIKNVQLDSNITLDGFASQPKLVFPPPQAGDDYEPAEGKVVMESTGSLLRIDVADPGNVVYQGQPNITISAPQSGTAATATAILVTKGPDKGKLKKIELSSIGSGYTLRDSIDVHITSSKIDNADLAIQKPVLTPILNLSIIGVEITTSGSGYAVEKPLKVMIEPVEPEKSTSVIGLAYPRAEKDSYTTFRKEGDSGKIGEYQQDMERQMSERGPVSGTVSGPDSSTLPPRPFWGGQSSSSQLLDLLPAGFGLEYDTTKKIYMLTVDSMLRKAYPGYMQPSSNRPLNPDFGPRGRAPIERDMELSLSTYLRFSLSGAICASSVHLALTPIDVVKTKVQTNPSKYPGIISSFETVIKEEGLSTFFSGWIPTVVGNFLSGAILYALTEYIRRYLSDLAGTEAVSLEVPIILVAAGTAAAFGSFLVCPFEAVRIRSVAQPDFAPNALGVVKKMTKEEGIGSLINAVPVFLIKNVPYAMTKFLVFDLSTEYLYDIFPAAHDDLKLSLGITLLGGLLGGTSAAIISNPADVVVSELKKSSTKLSPQEALQQVLDRGGVKGLSKGLPLRLIYYSLIASLQFFVYDSVRFTLDIGPDDLKLYLDVLKGALAENGGPL